MIDDNRNNWRQLGVRKRTCFVGTAIIKKLFTFKFILFFYLTRPLLLGEVPPLPPPPLLRRGLQPVNRGFGTRNQAPAPSGLLVRVLRNRVASVYAPRARCAMRVVDD